MNIKAQRILNKHLNSVKVADSNTHIINAMKEFAEEYHKEQLRIGGVSQLLGCQHSAVRVTGKDVGKCDDCGIKMTKNWRANCG